MTPPNRCGLSSWPTGWRGWLLVAVLATYGDREWNEFPEQDG